MDDFVGAALGFSLKLYRNDAQGTLLIELPETDTADTHGTAVAPVTEHRPFESRQRVLSFIGTQAAMLLPAGAYSVTVSAKGYEPFRAQATVAASSTTTISAKLQPRRPTDPTLDALPKSLQPKAKAGLHEIMNAEHREAAEAAVDRFLETYGTKYPKATEKLVKDREALLAHFEYPAEHWLHLRTTNAIESTFATVRLRTNKTKGAGSRSAGLAMAYKLLEAAQARWRCVNAPHLVALVRAGATFVDGVKVEREDRRSVA